MLKHLVTWVIRFKNRDLSQRRLIAAAGLLQLTQISLRLTVILGIALHDQGLLSEAVANYRRAITLRPDLPEAHSNLGNALQEQGLLEEAIASCRNAIALKPDYSEAYNNLGVALQEKGHLEEAASCYQKAISLNPDYAEAHNNLGVAFQDQGRLDEATLSFQKSMSLKPDYVLAHSSLLSNFNYCPNLSREEIHNESLTWDRKYAKMLTEKELAYSNTKDKNRKLKIGYVSPDFKAHSVAYFFEPLLKARNKERMEVFCYSNVMTPDHVTKRLKTETDHWRSIVGKSDEAVAKLIREDGIDILVDLAGHTKGNRLLVFGYKPAPIQITYLGFPNTTGLSTIDFRITDSFADPSGQTDGFYTEKLMRMPRTFLCYEAPENLPSIQKESFSKKGTITFGSFNNRVKINTEVIKVWSEILTRTANSRLILKAKQLTDSSVKDHLLELFRNHGVSPEQVILIEWAASSFDHFNLYNQIDIALDTFPYNGTTTTCEALWMGTPVIALKGDRHAGRVGVSLLSNVGTKGLIADSQEDYIEKAVALANDTVKLQQLQKDLRGMMEGSPLMDAVSFTRELETIYRRIWHGWCDGSEFVEETACQILGSDEPFITDTRTKTQANKDTQAAVFANKKGEALFELGDMEGAQEAFLNAIEIDPAYIVAHNNLGVFYWQQGDSEKAVEFLVKALKIDPLNQDANFNLEEILKSIGQDEKTKIVAVNKATCKSEQNVNAAVAENKPVIRILHNMARSGGTVISKCLGCMAQVLLLSEIHPFGSKWFNPLNQAHEWFNLLTADDMTQIKEAGEIPFNGAMDLINRRAAQQDKALIIRDWSHLDFTAVPFVEKPTYRLTTADMLSESFVVKHIATVRHPIDQWLSLKNLNIMKGKIFLEDFLRGYLKFAEFCREIGFVRYEDFTRSPEKAMKTLCEKLDVSYDPSFMEKWWQYTHITGDTTNSRGAKKEIKQTPRREIEPELLSRLQNNSDYLKVIELLGYEHPKEAKTITPVTTIQNENKDVNDRVNKLYAEFIEENKKFWADFSPSPSELDDKVILVDCLVDFPPYILGNLIIAKYLQKRNNAIIIGVVRDQSQLERNYHLLSSFAVEKVIYACERNSQQYNLDIEHILLEKNVKKLREKVLNFSIDGLKVGDLVYDAYLRDTGEPTIHSVNDVLVNYFYEAKRYYDIYDIFCKHNNVVSTVQGHTVYLMYGMMARVAVKNGATVFGRKPGSSPMAMRRYSTFEDLDRYEIGFRKEDFDRVYQNDKENAIAFATDYLEKRFNGYGRYKAPAYDPDEKKKYGYEQLVKRINLNPNKKTVVVMCHVFSDAPHCDAWMLHHDYFEWLQDTLEIISTIDNVNWIVKPHPDDKYYNGNVNYAVVETEKYTKKYNHIFLMPDDFNTAGMCDIADALVSIRGTAALEFSAMGLPCVVTGTLFYTGLGFTIEPKNREEYIQVLKNIHNSKLLQQHERDKALVCWYFYHKLVRVNCLFIPNVISNWYTKFNAENFWAESLISIRNQVVADDPLFKNLSTQLDKDLPNLMNF